MNAFSATSTAGWNHEQPRQTESVERLIRCAMDLFNRERVSISPSKASRLIRAHVRASGSVAVAARQLEAYVLSYADPTGETAVRNIMRGAHV